MFRSIQTFTQTLETKTLLLEGAYNQLEARNLLERIENTLNPIY